MDHCPDFDGVEIKIIAASSGAAAFLNDSSTGAFSFDADGNGVGAAVQLAPLQRPLGKRLAAGSTSSSTTGSRC